MNSNLTSNWRTEKTYMAIIYRCRFNNNNRKQDSSFVVLFVVFAVGKITPIFEENSYILRYSQFSRCELADKTRRISEVF